MVGQMLMVFLRIMVSQSIPLLVGGVGMAAYMSFSWRATILTTA
jgi:hypothetical protein